MTYDQSFTRWCALSPAARVVLVTDPVQQGTAECITAEMARPCEICLYDASLALREALATLSPDDLVIVLLSFDTMLDFSRERWFSPFGKPV